MQLHTDLNEQPTSEHKPTESSKFQLPESIVDFLQSIAIALVICIIMYLLIAMPNQVQGSSMEPNFNQGEIILTNKVSTWLGDTGIGRSIGLDYSRGDIVVFQKPGNSDFIKRIIGEPGDTVSIREGDVYINGKKLDESDYLDSTVFTEAGSFLPEGEQLIVPENSFFIMGDNRGNSQDSRSYEIGFVREEWIKGEVLLRYWPNITIFAHPDYNID